jgi:hypothetical protein
VIIIIPTQTYEKKVMDSDKIEIYNKLNQIKPSGKTLKYPFNSWTPEKIKFTLKDIELKFKNQSQNQNQKRGGGSAQQVTVF